MNIGKAIDIRDNFANGHGLHPKVDNDFLKEYLLAEILIQLIKLTQKVEDLKSYV